MQYYLLMKDGGALGPVTVKEMQRLQEKYRPHVEKVLTQPEYVAMTTKVYESPRGAKTRNIVLGTICMVLLFIAIAIIINGGG